jgi:hypothetical protein
VVRRRPLPLVERHPERSNSEVGRDDERRFGLPSSVRQRQRQRARPHGSARHAAWAIDDASFSAVPVLVDGSNGPTLHLRGMFETYNAQVDAADAAAEADAARASRDAVEREVQAQRR